MKCMLNTMAKRITKCLVEDGIISSDLADVYIYGFEVLVSSLFSTLLILFIGTLGRRFIETIIFLIVFIGLRSFTGGFHASTYWLCTTLTLSIYTIVMLFSSYLIIPRTVYLVLFPVGMIVLLLKSPVHNPNKYLTYIETKRYKIICIILFFLIMLVGMVLLNKQATISGIIYYTLIADLVLLFVKSHYVTIE